MRRRKWLPIIIVVIFLLWTLFNIYTSKCEISEKISILTNVKNFMVFSIQNNLLPKIIGSTFLGVIFWSAATNVKRK